VDSRNASRAPDQISGTAPSRSRRLTYQLAEYETRQTRNLSVSDGNRAFQLSQIILAIPEEEMTHLITVQSILTLLSGPLHLDREDCPEEFSIRSVRTRTAVEEIVG
jgi:hypothetical protein